MATYPGHKDTFDIDTGNWTLFTTNGTTSISNGERLIEKTSANAWDQTGIVRINAPGITAQPQKGDVVLVRFRLRQTFQNDSGVQVALNQNTSLTTANQVGFYFYRTPGGTMQIFILYAGTGNDTTIFTPQIGVEYQLRWTFDITTGFLQLAIQGGSSWPTFTDVGSGTVDFSTAFSSDFALQINLFSPTNDCAISFYEWSDAGGPSEPQVGSTGKKLIRQGIM